MVDILLETALSNYLRAGWFEWIKAWAFGVRRVVQSEGWHIKYYYYNGKYYLANIERI